MRPYFSVKQLPELGELSEQQRLVAFRRFAAYRTSAAVSRINFAEISLIGSIILAELAGFIGGWFYWRGFWGSLIGAVLAMWLVIAVYYFVEMWITLPKIRRFFQSEMGREIIREVRKL
jgi:hypothetical protein